MFHCHGPADVPMCVSLQHVQVLHADSDIGFSKEYEAIQAAATSEALSAEHSHHPDNKQKNRYLNIVACE